MTHPMDSQVTLVNHAAFSANTQNTMLLFDRDDMKNTTIHVAGDPRPSYFVKTVDSKTTISAVGKVLLAAVERKRLWQDRITFRDSPPTNLRNWLNVPKSILPITFVYDGRRFEWTKNLVGHLVLRESGNSSSLAWFSTSRRGQRDGHHVLYYAYLTIKPEGCDLMDMIVLSCILAEHKVRVKGNRHKVSQGEDTMNPFTFGI